jgi:outer membrane immunogenic protein
MGHRCSARLLADRCGRATPKRLAVRYLGSQGVACSAFKGAPMKKVLLASVAFAAMSSSASLAADLRRPLPPPVVPIAVPLAYNWSGFYIGAHGGGAWGDHCFNNLTVAGGCHDGSGWVGGGQIGFNWQSGQWVFGLEFSGSAVGLDGSHTHPVLGRFESDVGGLFLFTGRLGIAWSNVLAYVTGGGAWVHTSHTFTPPLLGSATVDAERWGWTIGAGLEFGFAQNWSLALQYNLIHLDERSTNFTVQNPITVNVDQKVNLLTARLNYRFGAGRY